MTVRLRRHNIRRAGPEPQIGIYRHLMEHPKGAVAQLGERHVRNVEVRGSIPLGSTIKP